VNADELANAVLAVKKYAGLDRALVTRLCGENAAKFAKPKDALKAVKKELHILYASFLPGGSHAAAAALLEGYEDNREQALGIMALHASTRERLAEAEPIYGYIGGFIQPGDGVADVGCGYNPFALPFYPVRPARYAAMDICRHTTGLLNRYFTHLQAPHYRAYIHDAALSPPPAAELLFLFKLFPLLERQGKGCGFALLTGAAYRTALVSFPLKSAGGREKGMKGFYSALFEGCLPPALAIQGKRVFANEMFYEVTKRV
jgi:16S rRNA (guanine(1405)-N(7))-methyltransferase